jgi:hypothetical protein
MSCGEYRSLVSLHAYAKRRLRRYSHPKDDPILSITGTTPSDQKTAEARANEAQCLHSFVLMKRAAKRVRPARTNIATTPRSVFSQERKKARRPEILFEPSRA